MSRTGKEKDLKGKGVPVWRRMENASVSHRNNGQKCFVTQSLISL